ncbi:MAG: stage III sporulation protein AF [Bacillota bacterium]
MLDAVREMVRNIAVIILLTSFLEMLISNNEMTKYVRLVMGLFIIIAVLTPVMSLLDKQRSSEVMAWEFQPESQSGQLASILENGKELSQLNIDEALEQYRARVEGQIRALALLVKGVNDALVSVELSTDATGYPQAITLVRVVVTPVGEEDKQKGPQIKEVNPVLVGGGNEGAGTGLSLPSPTSDTNKAIVDREQIVRGVKATVSSFYSLTQEKIMVTMDEESSDGSGGNAGGQTREQEN